MKSGLLLLVWILQLFAARKIHGQMLVENMARAGEPTEPSEYSYYTGGVNCLDDETECVDNSGCFTPTEHCDGINKCTDGSDEQNCTGSMVTPSNNTTSTPSSTDDSDYYGGYGGCDPPKHECPEGHCLEETDVCNGISDCGDGSDEQDCPTTEAPSTTTTTTAATTTEPDFNYYGCDPGQFQCDDMITCIPNHARCDGEFDCPNNDDEANCTMDMVTQTTPTPNVTCLFEGTTYQVDDIIVENNCTEVTCSQNGHILMWTNDDPTCGATTVAATYSFLISILASLWLIRS